MDYGKLELKLRKIVEKRLRRGHTLARHSYFPNGIDTVSCCALGAVIADRKWNFDGIGESDEMNLVICQRLGISEKVRWSIARGFDGGLTGVHEDHRAFGIGRRIYRDYCDTTDEVVS